MSELNQFSLFDYSDDEEWALFDDKREDVNKSNKSTTQISSSFEEIQRKKVFQVENFEFLKKKREESKIKNKNKHPWTEKEDKILTRIVETHPDFSWNEISYYLIGRTGIQCMHRWQKVLASGLKKGKWSPEEDRVLIEWVEKNGANRWSKLSNILVGRSSKQIRDRWINNLSPNRAKNFEWTDDLDRELLNRYLEHGSSWVHISQFIPNSTENMIKNRFYSMLRTVASKYNKNHKTNTKQIQSNKLAEENFFSSTSTLNKKKRNNFSLSILINYLPDLLKQKGVELKNMENIKNMKTANLNEDQKKILNNFFITLSNKLPEPSPQNLLNHHSLLDDKNKAQFKFKSTILLNLQLHLLQKIFQRCKLQIVSRFFNCFKGNSHPMPLNTNQII